MGFDACQIRSMGLDSTIGKFLKKEQRLIQMKELPEAQKSTPFYVQDGFILVLDILRYDIFVDPLNRLVNKLSEGTYSFLGDFLAILFAICALYLLLKYEG